jgi:hypothetical protein
MNRHFVEMLSALSDAGADYLVEFEKSWQRRRIVSVKDREFNFIGKDDLIASKRAAGRPNDFRDIEELERLPQ